MNFKKPVLPSMQKIWTIIILVIAVLQFTPDVRTYLEVKDIEPTYMPPSEFMECLNNDEVFVVCRASANEVIQFQLCEDISSEMKTHLFKEDKDVFTLDKSKWYQTTVYSSDSFLDSLTEHAVIVKKVDFDALAMDKIADKSRSILLFYILGLLILAVLPFNGKMLSPKYTIATTSNKRFSDIIGHEEVIEDLVQYIDILHNTKTFQEKGIKQPNGILFTGPPGTGKTLLAKALAGEAKLPFIYFNSSSAIDMYVGMGAKTVRSCFAKAKQVAPCILFIDELDAIGGNRGGRSLKTSEDNQTLLALLQELDGFEDLSGILVIGATNCPENLDPALKRAGRFDRQICINPPKNRDVRKQMFKLYTKNLTVADDVNFDDIAAQTQGMTGADIAAICNEAAILGIANHSGTILADDFTFAIDKFMLKGNRVKSKSEIQRDNQLIAYHEAGHAVATYLTGGKIARISVHETTSGVGGYVLQEEEDKLLTSKQESQNQLIVLYAGRASEEIKFGKDGITAGAANDIQKATNLISYMLLGYGYDDSLGLLDYNQILNSGLIDKGDIVKRMQQQSSDIYTKCVSLLQENYFRVEALAVALLEKEELTGEEATAIIESEELYNE